MKPLKPFIAVAALISGALLSIGTASAFTGNQAEFAVRINPPGYFPPPPVYSPPPPIIMPQQPVYASPVPVYPYPYPNSPYQAPPALYGYPAPINRDPNWHRHEHRDWRTGEDWQQHRDGFRDPRR